MDFNTAVSILGHSASIFPAFTQQSHVLSACNISCRLWKHLFFWVSKAFSTPLYLPSLCCTCRRRCTLRVACACPDMQAARSGSHDSLVWAVFTGLPASPTPPSQLLFIFLLLKASEGKRDAVSSAARRLLIMLLLLERSSPSEQHVNCGRLTRTCWASPTAEKHRLRITFESFLLLLKLQSLSCAYKTKYIVCLCAFIYF